MHHISEHLKYFQDKHPEIYEAYAAYGKKIHEAGGPLDHKQRALIKVAISATNSRNNALRTHINKALQAGCTADEIEHTILLTAPSVGFPCMMESLLIFRECVGQPE